MKKKDKLVTAAAILLVITMIVGVSAIGANYGTPEDPLITLSYLTDILTPSIKSQADAKVNEIKGALETEFNNQLHNIEQQLSNADNTVTITHTYSVVSLESGKTLTGSVGTELMLRVGTAVCSASSATGLIDTTTASVLENGQSMVKNHMYMVTIEGRGMKATSSVMVLVRGDYTIS